MNRIWLIAVIATSMTLVAAGSWYFLPYVYHWSQCCTEQEAIAYMEHELLSFKSLNFSPSSEVITMLESHIQYLKQINRYYSASDNLKKHDALIAINKKMLQNYMKDLQMYAKKESSHNNIVQFSYDKVIRLTIALANLEQCRDEGLPSEEYLQKIDRMHEITQQAIVHSKKTLRMYFYNGFDEHHPKVQAERQYVTNKVAHLIELDKILYF